VVVAFLFSNLDYGKGNHPQIKSIEQENTKDQLKLNER
jgi:hypothetical protein